MEKLMLQSLTPLQMLQVFEELIFTVTAFKFQSEEEINTFTANKLNLVFK